MLADQKKGFDVFIESQPYGEVRAVQLQAQVQTRFSSSFLYHLQSRLIETVDERLKVSGDAETRTMVDNLVMLLMLNGKVEFGKLTGLDDETLADVVAQSTRLVEW